MYYEFSQPLVKMGHQVEHFDHARIFAESGADTCGQRFFDQVKQGNYDVVLYQIATDWMRWEAVSEAAQYAPIVAWNCDDDWRWESYTKNLAQYFTFMVTTYPHIYEANKREYPNLVLSQWGCLDTYGDFNRKKDLDFSFAGQIYGHRATECEYLRRRAGLRAFGLGRMKMKYPFLYQRGIRRITKRVPAFQEKALSFEQINDVWNRSKISFTPMGASEDPKILQIKSRTFEMGLSGTLMLCQHSPNLDRYYEPNKEFVPFDDLEDCADKAKYYLKHEAKRVRIAMAYYKRTQAEHLWQHRFQELFRHIGVEKSSRVKSNCLRSIGSRIVVM